MGGKSLMRLKQEWYWKAKMEELGKLQANREMSARQDRKKPVADRVLDWIERKISEIDPIEAAAVAGLTVVIQPIVETSEVFLDHIQKHPDMLLMTIINPAWGLLETILPLAGIPGAVEKPTATQKILSYILAFIIAAIIIKYLPQIITGASDITKLVNVNGILGGLLGAITI